MAKEIVEAVRQVELNAAQTEKDALKERDSIILAAQKSAEEIISSMTQDALTKSKSDLIQAQRKSEEILDAAVQKAEKEIIRLKEIANSREKAAIEIVISEVK